VNLTLKRVSFGEKATLGELSVDGVFECLHARRRCAARAPKVFGKTAIPFGTYPITIERSPHLSRSRDTTSSRRGCTTFPGSKAC
jgi:hypothetical protein